MTILTKPSSDKKPEKAALPLPVAGGCVVAYDDVAMLQGGLAAQQGGKLLTQQQPTYNPDYDAESMVFNRPQHSCIKTIVLFLISVLVMMLGILGGYSLYRMYAPAHSNLHYRALCDIPYLSRNNTMPRFYAQNDDFDLNWRSLMPRFVEDPMRTFDDEKFFREEIEMSMDDDDSYAKIDVPDFKDGRRGRFMHDFKENQSAIIDTTANRCFIMPLDRDTTLPPRSLLDMIQKMGTNYYNIDTDRVRRTMRVVTPPITDLTTISDRIANECYDMKVYMLENYVSGVSKREVRLIGDSGKFAEFSGKGVVEFDLLNIADIEKFEQTHLQQK